jgi:hypothetical protein
VSIHKQFVSSTVHNENLLLLLLFLLSFSLLATFQEIDGLRDPFRALSYSSKEFHINYGNNHSDTQEKRNMILEGATLIDGTTAPPKRNSIIAIDGNMITDK